MKLLLTCQLQEVDELLELVFSLCGIYDLDIIAGIISLDVRINGLVYIVGVQKGFGKSAPYLWITDLLSEFGGTLDVIKIVDQNLDGFFVASGLLVDQEGFLVQTVLSQGNLG